MRLAHDDTAVATGPPRRRRREAAPVYILRSARIGPAYGVQRTGVGSAGADCDFTVAGNAIGNAVLECGGGGKVPQHGQAGAVPLHGLPPAIVGRAGRADDDSAVVRHAPCDDRSIAFHSRQRLVSGRGDPVCPEGRGIKAHDACHGGAVTGQILEPDADVRDRLSGNINVGNDARFLGLRGDRKGHVRHRAGA